MSFVISAKDLATIAVENGMSIRPAVKEYGIHFSTLQYHLNLQKRVSSTDAKLRECVIATAIESVDSKRLSVFGANLVVYFLVDFSLTLSSQRRQLRTVL